MSVLLAYKTMHIEVLTRADPSLCASPLITWYFKLTSVSTQDCAMPLATCHGHHQHPAYRWRPHLNRSQEQGNSLSSTTLDLPSLSPASSIRPTRTQTSTSLPLNLRSMRPALRPYQLCRHSLRPAHRFQPGRSQRRTTRRCWYGTDSTHKLPADLRRRQE
jgi:hypothetical protein